jgi:hypothetical protein
MSRRLVPCLACLLLPCVGCGTLYNFNENRGPKFNTDHIVPAKSVYGGTRLDAHLVALPPTYALFAPAGAWSDGHAEIELGQITLLAVVAAADLPLSAVADTVALPTTIPAAISRQQEAMRKATAPPVVQVNGDLPPTDGLPAPDPPPNSPLPTGHR